MTTREQLKRAVGIDRSDASRGATAEPAPTLPERLYAARERKGVDLYRAERDTKIRARYLGALERGDYKELPGAVYTKGFLRNYALYLGLDPDDVLVQWRRERGDGKEAAPAIVVPKPIAAPRQGLTFSPSLVVAALLTVVILAFGAYLGVQVLRFAKPPTIAVTQPATAVIDVDDSTTTYTLRGTTLAGRHGVDRHARARSVPGHRRTRRRLVGRRRPAPRSQPVRRECARSETGKNADRPRSSSPVPFLVIEAPTLTVDQPAGRRVVRERRHPGGQVTPRTPRRSCRHTARSARRPPPGAGLARRRHRPRPWAPSPCVADDGTYNTPLELTAGRWSITVTASSTEGKTPSLTRNVTVVYKGVNLVVTVKNGRAWIKVWVDGKIDPGMGVAGQVISSGKTLTFTGKQSVEVRTGSSGVTFFTLNGTSLGRSALRRPRDVAVRPAGPTAKDPAAVAVAEDPLADSRPARSSSCARRAAVPSGITVADRDGGILHRRPGRPPHHRRCPVRAAGSRRLRDLLGRAQARDSRRPARRPGGPRRGLGAGRDGDGDRWPRPDRRGPRGLGDRDRRARRRNGLQAGRAHVRRRRR